MGRTLWASHARWETPTARSASRQPRRRLVLGGDSTAQIAERLVVSPHSVRAMAGSDLWPGVSWTRWRGRRLAQVALAGPIACPHRLRPWPMARPLRRLGPGVGGIGRARRGRDVDQHRADPDLLGAARARPRHPASPARRAGRLAARPGARPEPTALGVELLVEGIVITVVVGILTLRSRPSGEEPSHFTSSVVISAIGTLPFIVAGVSLLADAGGGLSWVLAGSLCALVGSMLNAWVLLVEILRRTRPTARSVWCSEERGGHRLGDESAVAARRPAAAQDEQLVELGGAVGPQDVGGLLERDAAPQPARAAQAARVGGHASPSVGVELGLQRPDLGVGAGGVAHEQEDRRDARSDLGDQSAPCLDDRPRVRRLLVERVGAQLRWDGAFALERPVADRPDQPG